MSRCVRLVLQAIGYSAAAIEAHLGRASSLRRYSDSFRWAVVLLQKRNVDVTGATVAELSSVVCDLSTVSASHAANAYSAFLLFSHLHMLRYDEVVKRPRKQCIAAAPKYASFFDAFALLQRLVNERLNKLSVSQVRDRLCMIWHLF